MFVFFNLLVFLSFFVLLLDVKGYEVLFFVLNGYVVKRLIQIKVS